MKKLKIQLFGYGTVFKNLNLEINTIDGFQGKEKDIIILSLVRSNSKGLLGFLRDYRRINVAITRSKSKLLIVGNKSSIIKDIMWKN